MTVVAVDASGRLSELVASPDPIEQPASGGKTDWRKLFDVAGISFDAFTPVTPQMVPPIFADERMAWEGKLADRPEHTIHVEAGAKNGRPVYFTLRGPWSRSAREVGQTPPLFTRIIGALATVIMPGLMVLGAVLARRNVKMGRGDRQGAFRAAAFVFSVSLFSWVLGASHFSAIGLEVSRIFAAIGRALFDASVLWLTYLGLEPYIRRHSPDSILGWSRLLAGHWRDPRVGVDVLVGVSAGLAMTVLYAAHNVLPPLAGYPEPMPAITDVGALMSTRQVLSPIVYQVTNALSSAMLGVVGVVGFGLALRRRWLAALAAIVFFTPVALNGMFPPGTPRLDLAIGGGIIAIFVLVIIRAGLLSAAAALFTHFILLRAPITLDLSSWRAPYGLWYVGVVAGLGLGACYIARKGQGNSRLTTSSPAP
jgi:hypothetical protein